MIKGYNNKGLALLVNETMGCVKKTKINWYLIGIFHFEKLNFFEIVYSFQALVPTIKMAPINFQSSEETPHML